MLKVTGIESDTALDGQEALSHVFSQRYDLVLMDAQTPVIVTCASNDCSLAST